VVDFTTADNSIEKISNKNIQAIDGLGNQSMGLFMVPADRQSRVFIKQTKAPGFEAISEIDRTEPSIELPEKTVYSFKRVVHPELLAAMNHETDIEKQQHEQV